MSLSLNNVYKLFLKKRVKDEIILKVNDIQDCYKWLNLDLEINLNDLNLTTLKYCDIVHELNILEEITKLSMDLLRNYDHYRKFTFESQYDSKEYRERLESIGYVCQDNGTWRCVNRPSEDVVQINVFMFCLYRLICQELSSMMNICCFCEWVIDPGEDHCNQCYARLEEIMSYKEIDADRKREESIKKKEGRNDQSLDGDYCCTGNIVEAVTSMEDQDKKVDVSCQTSANISVEVYTNTSIRMEDVSCQTMEINNFPDYRMDNFYNKNDSGLLSLNIQENRGKVSSKKRITIGCIYCTCHIKPDDETCSACGSNVEKMMIEEASKNVTKVYGNIPGNVKMSGEDIAVGVFIDKRTCDNCGSMMDDNDKCNKCINEATIIKDQWKCSKCSNLHSYFENMCDECGATKFGSGKWQCGKCTFENDCKNKQCTICDEKNHFLMGRYCDRCKVVVVTENKKSCDDCEKYSNPNYKPKQWICQYPRCDADNSDVDKYCRTCRLQRDYPRGRGDNIKMWFDDKEIIMWICTRCYVINKQHELVCRNCQETRFKKKYCKKCQQYNDGTTNNCDKCYQRL